MNTILSYPKLYPLITSGNGNCLLHAAALGKKFRFMSVDLTMEFSIDDIVRKIRFVNDHRIKI